MKLVYPDLTTHTVISSIERTGENLGRLWSEVNRFWLDFRGVIAR